MTVRAHSAPCLADPLPGLARAQALVLKADIPTGSGGQALPKSPGSVRPGSLGCIHQKRQADDHLGNLATGQQLKDRPNVAFKGSSFDDTQRVGRDSTEVANRNPYSTRPEVEGCYGSWCSEITHLDISKMHLTSHCLRVFQDNLC